MNLRAYQRDALDRVYASGSRAVCLVAPTGSGKTVMAATWATERPGRTLWVAHRIELVKQSADALERIVGPLEIGVIAPGFNPKPHARIQIGTIQSLLARGTRPDVARVVLDECHHYSADDWSTLLDSYPDVHLVGLTATPERSDGRPLGDIFDTLVVAARYPELVRDGHLVNCRAFQPPDPVSGGLALDPVDAYLRHGDSGRAFAFVGRVEHAEKLARSFSSSGIEARAISQHTAARDRADALRAFAAGDVRVLTNVYALTEGVDVPAASVAIIARPIRHVSMYLQIAGRVLRPHPEKSVATIIDLVGATIVHGLPIEDRIYSLEGKAITRCTESLTQCPACGAVFTPAPGRACPECGLTPPPRQAPADPHIYSLDLRAVYAGPETPPDAKRAEFIRLWRIARDRGWSLSWVVKQYEKLFFATPLEFTAAMRAEIKREEYDRLRARAVELGHKPGAAAHRYRAIFGQMPPWEWARA